MSALNSFFEKQKTLGRASLVAACIASFAAPHRAEAHYDGAAMPGVSTVIFDGEAQRFISGADGVQTLNKIVQTVNGDMNAIERFADSIQSPASLKSLDIYKASLKTAISTLNADQALRTDFETMQVDDTTPNFDAVKFLAERANQRMHWVDDMDQELKLVGAALGRRDMQALTEQMNKIRNDIVIQEHVEDGLRSMGYATGR